LTFRGSSVIIFNNDGPVTLKVSISQSLEKKGLRTYRKLVES
jgi:hypothetical protein